MKRFLVYLSLPLLLIGCMSRLSPTRHAYLLQLNEPVKSAQKPIANTLLVAPAHVLAPYAGREFVYHKADNTYQSDYYHLFFVPPAQHVTHLMHTWMTQTGLFQHVISSSAMAKPNYVLQVVVTQLNADDTVSPAVGRVAMRVSLLKTHNGIRKSIFHHTYHHATVISPANADGLVNAWQDAMVAELQALTADMQRVVSKHQA
ncbi:MAG: hypothetical protein DHS20C10_01200 [marine bacterium B5-7]|nr:MAG: hypothetical protein DHS20C10_01200 [marine bacterium B5-7]